MLFCPLCSGSSGNAAYLEAGGLRFLIDAGLTAKRITELLDTIGVSPMTIDGILVTHEHTDHVSGVGVLSRRYGIPVYADAECFAAMPPQVGEIAPRNMRVFAPDEPFLIRSVRITPFSTPHDSAHSVGYSIEDGGKKLTVMTDVGHIGDKLLAQLAGSALVLVEANHDVDMLMAGPYPFPLKRRILSPRGHLSNEDCGQALAALRREGIENVVLGHLSNENNTPDLARITVETILESAGAPPTMHVTVAERYAPTGMFRIA